MHTFDVAAIGRAGWSDAVVRFLGEGVAGLVQYHGFIVLLFEELDQLDFLIQFPQSCLQSFILCLELSQLLAVKDFLTSIVDMGVGVLEVYLLLLALLLDDLEVSECHLPNRLFHCIQVTHLSIPVLLYLLCILRYPHDLQFQTHILQKPMVVLLGS